MKLKLLALLTVLIASCIFGQNFKDVKTGQDAIDNYVTANGGVDNLKSIKSVSMEGIMSFMGTNIPLKLYVSMDAFYMDFQAAQFGMTAAMDLKKKKGWSKMGSQIKDATLSEMRKNEEMASSTLWGYYYDKDKHGISYELLQNEQVNGKDAYAVDFKKGEEIIQTVFFDAETFQRVKQIKGNNTSEYTESKSVDGSGIYMPYLIKTPQGDVSVKEYRFNSSIDKKLLKKPKVDKSKEEKSTEDK
jgi:hypothetical protein